MVPFHTILWWSLQHHILFLLMMSYFIILYHILTIWCNYLPFWSHIVLLLHNMFSSFHHGLFPGTLSPITNSFIHSYKQYKKKSSQLLQSSDSSLNLLARVSSTKWVFSLTGSSLHCCLYTWLELAIPICIMLFETAMLHFALNNDK